MLVYLFGKNHRNIECRKSFNISSMRELQTLYRRETTNKDVRKLSVNNLL